MSKSLLKPEKRELAFDWIAKNLSSGALNSASLIVKIYTICQNPEGHTNTKDSITEWRKHIFSSKFRSSFEDWSSEQIISPEKRFKIENLFFYYYASYMPIFFLNKKFKTSRFKACKWTKKDFEDLKSILIEEWFYEQYQEAEQRNVEDLKIVENRVRKVLSSIKTISKERLKRFSSSNQREFFLSTSHIEYEINDLLPDFKYPYQTDLFEIYLKEFMIAIPNTLENFESKFYESGDYLHSFFVWNKH